MSNSQFKDIESLESELLTCTMCGFCKNVCPAFLDSRWDFEAPRGRMTMAYGLITNQLEPDDGLLNSLFQCTQCQDCKRRCPSKAACPDVVLAARREMVERKFTTEYQNRLVENIQTSGNIYGDQDAEAIQEAGTWPMFVGCQYLARPNSVRKIVKFLKKIDVKPAIKEEVCCAFPLHIMGFQPEAEAQMKQLSCKLPVESQKDIITLCPSCLKQLKEEYQLPAVHILEIIAHRLQNLSVSRPLEKTVVYHDPCDLSRGAGIVEEPRRILRHIGANLLEMEHSGSTSRCCGGGGGILTWDEDLSLRMASRRITEAREAGAEMLVTACPTCEQNLKRGAQQEAAQTSSKPLPVRHLFDILIKATK